MYTLFDFTTYIKGEEYIIAITFIALFVLYWEILSPRPFVLFTAHVRDDIAYLIGLGLRRNAELVIEVVSAPFIATAYAATVPFLFLYGAFLRTAEMLGPDGIDNGAKRPTTR